MEGEVIQFPGTPKIVCAQGSAGLRSYAPGQMASVSNLAAATGGIGGKAGLVQQATDQRINFIKNHN